MRLEFDLSEGTPERRAGVLFHKCFDHVASTLSLEKWDSKVLLTFADELGSVGPGTQAVTNSIMDEDFTIRCAVDTRYPMMAILHAFSHELVHVKQIRAGRLTAVMPDPKDDSKSYILWEGERFDKDRVLQGRELIKDGRPPEVPWEQEAYKQMDALFLGFFQTLSETDQLYLVRSLNGGGTV